MKAPDTDRFYAEVYDVVRQIPPGRVLSYGRIAELIGWPNHSRLVGRAMHDAPLALLADECAEWLRTLGK